MTTRPPGPYRRKPMGDEGDEIIGGDWVGTTEVTRLRTTPRSHSNRIAAILSAVKPNPFLPLV